MQSEKNDKDLSPYIAAVWRHLFKEKYKLWNILTMFSKRMIPQILQKREAVPPFHWNPFFYCTSCLHSSLCLSHFYLPYLFPRLYPCFFPPWDFLHFLVPLFPILLVLVGSCWNYISVWEGGVVGWGGVATACAHCLICLDHVYGA